MYLVNTETIPGYRVTQSLGLVQGNTIRAKHIGKDFMAGLKNIVGGEIRGYTELLADARNEAVQRMIQLAQSMGANAIVNVRFSTASVMQAAAEMFAYGTAVIVEPENVG
ncbi:MAG: YbjQ family protein [Planctomycetes bacterium]|nr:YbjQ family protein [Planctomycetota bacterium]MCA8946731.1 YbjQ family protein [Planctomycetota bacterium]